jgi:hypothetical protein
MERSGLDFGNCGEAQLKVSNLLMGQPKFDHIPNLLVFDHYLDAWIFP